MVPFAKRQTNILCSSESKLSLSLANRVQPNSFDRVLVLWFRKVTPYQLWWMVIMNNHDNKNIYPITKQICQNVIWRNRCYFSGFFVGYQLEFAFLCFFVFFPCCGSAPYHLTEAHTISELRGNGSQKDQRGLGDPFGGAYWFPTSLWFKNAAEGDVGTFHIMSFESA